MDKLKKFNNYKERQLRKATTARQKRTINSKKFFNTWKREERLKQIIRTSKRVEKAVYKLDIDFYSQQKIERFIKGKGLNTKAGITRANKMIKEINGGYFNLDKWLKRNKSYQRNIKELNGKKFSFYEKTKILYRDVFYYDNRELIIEYHKTPYGPKYKTIEDELVKRYKEHQNKEIDDLIKKYSKK